MTDILFYTGKTTADIDEYITTTTFINRANGFYDGALVDITPGANEKAALLNMFQFKGITTNVRIDKIRVIYDDNTQSDINQTKCFLVRFNDYDYTDYFTGIGLNYVPKTELQTAIKNIINGVTMTEITVLGQYLYSSINMYNWLCY